MINKSCDTCGNKDKRKPFDCGKCDNCKRFFVDPDETFDDNWTPKEQTASETRIKPVCQVCDKPLRLKPDGYTVITCDCILKDIEKIETKNANLEVVNTALEMKNRELVTENEELKTMVNRNAGDAIYHQAEKIKLQDINATLKAQLEAKIKELEANQIKGRCKECKFISCCDTYLKADCNCSQFEPKEAVKEGR